MNHNFKIPKSECRFSLQIEPDTDVLPQYEIDGNADELAEINRRREAGDDWAWCVVTVTCTWTDPRTGTTYTGADQLSGCSYTDEADFRRGGYFDDMCEQAYAELCKKSRPPEAEVPGRQLVTYNLSLEDLEVLHAALHVCLYQRSQSSQDPSQDPQWSRLVDLDRQVLDAIDRRKSKTKNTLRI